MINGNYTIHNSKRGNVIMYTYDKKYAAHMGNEIVTVPDQIAANQLGAADAGLTFPVLTRRGKVMATIDADATGLYTTGTGDLVVQTIDANDAVVGDTEYTAADLVLCTSPDGWSLHAPGATDDQIASGDAPYLMSGDGEPAESDYDTAYNMYLARDLGYRVESGSGDDYDTGRVVRIDGDMAYVAWDSGVRAPCPVSDLRIVE